MSPDTFPVLKRRVNQNRIGDLCPPADFGKPPVCKDDQFDIPALAHDRIKQLISHRLRARGLGRTRETSIKRDPMHAFGAHSTSLFLKSLRFYGRQKKLIRLPINAKGFAIGSSLRIERGLCLSAHSDRSGFGKELRFSSSAKLSLGLHLLESTAQSRSLDLHAEEDLHSSLSVPVRTTHQCRLPESAGRG